MCTILACSAFPIGPKPFAPVAVRFTAENCFAKEKELIRRQCFFAILFLFAITTACAAQRLEAPFAMSIDGPTLYFRGKISTQAATGFENVIASNNITTLNISSAGGDAGAALRIAKIVRDRRLVVIVERVCASACLLPIFAAAKKKRLLPGAVLLIHGGPAANRLVLQNSPLRRAEALFATQVRADEVFDRSIGVRINYGLLANLLRPLCVVEQPGPPLNDPYRYGVGWRFAGLVPTREQLRSIGVDNVEGDFPTTQSLTMWLRRAGFRSDFHPLFAPQIILSGHSSFHTAVGLCPKRQSRPR